jgi:hypothetical protein
VPTSTSRWTPAQRDGLGHVPAHGEAEQVDVVQAERVDERTGVPCHALDGVGGGAAAGADAGVVEKDHLASGCQGVGDRRVEVVQVPHEVLDQDDRPRGTVSDPTIGEPHSRRLDEHRRSCRMAEIIHRLSQLCLCVSRMDGAFSCAHSRQSRQTVGCLTRIGETREGLELSWTA